MAGCAIVHLNDKSVLAREGTVLTLPGGTQATQEALRPLHTVSWTLAEDFIALHSQWVPLSHPLRVTLEAATATPPQPGVVQLSQQAFLDIREPLLHLAKLERHNRLTHFERLARVAQVLDYMDPRGPSHPDPEPLSVGNTRRSEVTAALRLVEDRIDQSWTVGALAKEVALSPSQLTRSFQAMLGMSPIAYLWRRRTEVMAELLRTSALTVEDAARTAGWHSRAAASRAFRKRYGMPPRDFAKRARHQSF